MAAVSTSNLSAVLMRTYSQRDWFAPFERKATPFLDQCQDFDNEAPLGAGRYFELWLQDSHNTGATAESGNLSSISAPSSQQGSVTGIQIQSVFGVSELMMSAGANGGNIGMDIIHRLVEVSTRNLMTAINHNTLGHGTGRLALVNANTSSSTSFTCKLPEFHFQLRSGQRISFYDLDTGGTIQNATGTTTTVAINYVNPATGVVTLDTSSTLTANWGVYQSLSATGTLAGASVTTYGVATNGIRGIVDAGTYASTIFGLSRATYPDLNAQVLDTTTGQQAYSEALVRKGINLAFYASGADVESLWCNRGIISEHINSLVGDRRYTVSGAKDVPGYAFGYDPNNLAFMYKGKAIPFKVDEDLPARELYGLTNSLWRRHILRKASWLGDGSGADGSPSPVLMQTPATSTYATSKIGAMMWIGNVAHISPKSQIVWRNIADSELAGDIVPSP